MRNIYGVAFGLAVAMVFSRGGHRAGAQGTPSSVPLVQHTFEQGKEGWVVFGASAKVSVTSDENRAKQGKSALRFDYKVAKGDFNALILPITDDSLGKAQSFRFWVQTDRATPLAMMLQERGGGRFYAVFSVPQDTWQQVILTPSDFGLADGPGDPKDPNNKLDLDQIEGVGLTDLGQLFIQAGEAEAANLFRVTPGSRTLYLDNLVVSDEAPGSPTGIAGIQPIDSFARPQVSWLAMGGVTLKSSLGKPLDGRGMQADYRTATNKLAGFARGVAPGLLRGTARLVFDVASTRATKLIVQVEEKGGGKYNTIVEVPADKTLKKVDVAFDLFTPSDDSKDANNKLDIAQIKQIVIIDASSFLDGTEQVNTLWMGNLRALVAR